MRGNSVPTALCWPLLGLQKPTAPPNSTSCLYADTPKAGLTLDISLFLKCRRRFHIFLSLYLNTRPRPPPNSSLAGPTPMSRVPATTMN